MSTSIGGLLYELKKKRKRSRKPLFLLFSENESNISIGKSQVNRILLLFFGFFHYSPKSALQNRSWGCVGIHEQLHTAAGSTQNRIAMTPETSIRTPFSVIVLRCDRLRFRSSIDAGNPLICVQCV